MAAYANPPRAQLTAGKYQGPAFTKRDEVEDSVQTTMVSNPEMTRYSTPASAGSGVEHMKPVLPEPTEWFS